MATQRNWEEIYGGHDGYSLYEQLKYGQSTVLTHKGTPYRFQFRGATTGHNNWLEVFDNKGASKTYKPGYELETVFAALEELVAGWKTDRKQT